MRQPYSIAVSILPKAETVLVQLPPDVFHSGKVTDWQEHLRELPDFQGCSGSLLDAESHLPASDTVLKQLCDGGVNRPLLFGQPGRSAKVQVVQSW